MSKALDKAQADLDAFKAELEAFIAAGPVVTPAPAPTALDTLAVELETLVYGAPIPAPEPAPKLAPTVLPTDPRRYMELAYTAQPVAVPVARAAQPQTLRRRMATAYLDGYRNGK